MVEVSFPYYIRPFSSQRIIRPDPIEISREDRD